MEKFMLVERKKTLVAKALQVVMILLAIAGLVLTISTWNPFAFLLTCVLVILAVVTIRKYTEFEYSYFDGEVRFSKIINKSRRKQIGTYQMDETNLIAPSGDRSVYNHEKNSTYKVRTLTSGNPEAKVYIMVAKGEKGMELIKFEPDEEFLSEICKKYAHKVKK